MHYGYSSFSANAWCTPKCVSFSRQNQELGQTNTNWGSSIHTNIFTKLTADIPNYATNYLLCVFIISSITVFSSNGLYLIIANILKKIAYLPSFPLRPRLIT